jgi:hypothetical protein
MADERTQNIPTDPEVNEPFEVGYWTMHSEFTSDLLNIAAALHDFAAFTEDSGAYRDFDIHAAD